MGSNSQDIRIFILFEKMGKERIIAGGLSVYIRDEISDGVSVIHGETLDYIWVKMDKIVFHLEENIYIGFVYILPWLIPA